MTYQIIKSGRFKKDYKLAEKRGYDTNLIKEVIRALANGDQLCEKYQDHPLRGEWDSYRECHILPDWLLIYKYDHQKLYLYLTRTGTHDDLFKT